MRNILFYQLVPVVSKKVCTWTFLSALTVIPSLGEKRRVSAQVQVYTTHRQPAETSTGPSTPRGRNWRGPSPILSAQFEEVGSKTGNPDNVAGRTAAGGKQGGFLQLNLKTKEIKTKSP